MIPILMGLAGAIGAATELFTAGKRVYAEVTGEPSAAGDADELIAEVAVRPPEQQAAFVAAMEAEIRRYRAETDRLEVEQARISAELLQALPPEAAAEVALLRMTTRPKIVLRMSHVILIPAYVLAVDAATMLFNNVMASAGATIELRLLALTLFASGSVYEQLYTWAAPTAASVVIAYMGLRSGEKLKEATGRPAGGAIGQAAAAAGSLLERIRGLLKR